MFSLFVLFERKILIQWLHSLSLYDINIGIVMQPSEFFFSHWNGKRGLTIEHTHSHTHGVHCSTASIRIVRRIRLNASTACKCLFKMNTAAAVATATSLVLCRLCAIEYRNPLQHELISIFAFSRNEFHFCLFFVVVVAFAVATCILTSANGSCRHHIVVDSHVCATRSGFSI